MSAKPAAPAGGTATRHGAFIRVEAVALLIVATIAVYFPGLRGPYVLDDEDDIVHNQAIAITDLNPAGLAGAAISLDSGPLKRPLAALSFALNHYFAGGLENRLSFKATNLAIHIANTFLVLLLLLRLTRAPALRERLTPGRREIIAFAGASLWALHPIQLTNVLYVVQRMNSLAALFVLAGLVMFLHGRERLSRDSRRGLTYMAAGTAIAVGPGVLAKENAALMPLLALVIEYVLFERSALARATRVRLLIFYAFTVAMPCLGLLVYLALDPAYLSETYINRAFTPLQHLWTEARVLWSYVHWILAPLPQQFGLFHDDIVASQNLFSPPMTAIAVSAWLAVIGTALVMSRKYPIASFAALWFIAGHALESGFLGLEIAFEHRNYIPSLGIFFGLAYLCLRPIRSAPVARTCAVLLSVVLLGLATTTWSIAGTWASVTTLADSAVRSHPASPRANDFAARVALKPNGDLTEATRYTVAGLKTAPQEAGFHLDLQILMEVVSREVDAHVDANTKRGPSISRIELPGMPDCVHASFENGMARVRCDLTSSGTIISFLREKPITVHTMLSLENLRRCITKPPHPCRDLQSAALGWFAAARENPRLSAEYRAALHANTAYLLAFDGALSEAHDHIQQAITLSPGTFAYHLDAIEILTRLGRLAEAAAMLAEAEEHANRLPFLPPNERAGLVSLRTGLERAADAGASRDQKRSR